MVIDNCWCSTGLHFRVSFLSDLYINDIKHLSPATKLFADEAFIFSVVHNVNLSTKQLNGDLRYYASLK